MPRYFKRRRRFTYGRRPYTRRPTRRVTKRVKRVERAVKTLSNTIETKRLDWIVGQNSGGVLTPTTVIIPTDGQTITSSGVMDQCVAYLPALSTGTGQNQRNGNQVTLTSLDFLLRISSNSSTTFNNVRIMLVKWKFWGGAGSAGFPLASLLQPNGAVGVPYNPTFMAPYNWANRDTYRVLYDKTITIVPQATGEGCVRVIRKHLKLKMKITYNGTSGSVTNCQNNALFLYVMGDASTSAPSMTGYLRLKFRDA